MMRTSPEGRSLLSHNLEHLILCNARVGHRSSHQLRHLPPGYLQRKGKCSGPSHTTQSPPRPRIWHLLAC
jgi:hypothetical protein